MGWILKWCVSIWFDSFGTLFDGLNRWYFKRLSLSFSKGVYNKLFCFFSYKKRVYNFSSFLKWFEFCKTEIMKVLQIPIYQWVQDVCGTSKGRPTVALCPLGISLEILVWYEKYSILYYWIIIFSLFCLLYLFFFLIILFLIKNFLIETV